MRSRVQTLPLADIVNALTRQSILSDMLQGGVARGRWSAQEGENALKVIHAKRRLADIAENLDAGTLRAVDDQDTLDQLMRQDSTTRFLAARKLGSTREAAEHAKRRKRRRMFRRVCAS